MLSVGESQKGAALDAVRFRFDAALPRVECCSTLWVGLIYKSLSYWSFFINIDSAFCYNQCAEHIHETLQRRQSGVAGLKP